MDELKKGTENSGKPLLGRPDIKSLEKSLNDNTIPKLYANSFVVGHSFVDATILAQTGETPVVAIVLPFVSLKALAKAINDTIEKIESGLGHPLLNIEQTRDAWTQNLKKQSNP